MVRANGRNVQKNIAVKSALTLLTQCKKVGLSKKTLAKLGGQLFSEQLKPDRVVRRRSCQAEMAFDIYMHQLKKSLPDISFFFTNHLASSMHRYWPATFPDDYPQSQFDGAWQSRWKHEIPHALSVADIQLNSLVEFCDATGYELIVCSSMGQAAVPNAQPLSNQVLIKDLKALMKFCALQEADWEQQLAMAPRVIIRPSSEHAMKKVLELKQLTVCDHQLDVSVTSTGDIRLFLEITNVETLTATFKGRPVDPEALGIEVVELQDQAGSYAYHIPEGLLIHYTPNSSHRNNVNVSADTISVLDFAPSLLQRFDCPIPAYMKGNRYALNFSGSSSL